jgi:hypothetical protein
MMLMSVAPEKWDDMVVKKALNASNVNVDGSSTASESVFVIDHQPEGDKNGLDFLW